jgi:hypothetical protein
MLNIVATLLSPDAAFNHYLVQERDLVSHDAVDAKVKQAVHFTGFVDGPHVYLQPGCVGAINERPSHDWQWSLTHRHLRGKWHRVAAKRRWTAHPGAESHLRDIARAHRRADALAELTANGIESSIAE